MRFIVYGAGAVGSVVAARLSRHYRVALVAREAHARAIRERGLEIRGKTEMVARDLVATSRPEELAAFRDPAPVILLTVKSYDTKAAVEALEPFWTEAIFVSLQNGLGNEEAIAERAPRVLSAVINQGAIFLEPGVVFHAGERDTYFGPFAGAGAEDVERLAEAFVTAGMAALAVPDVERRLWEKTILNAAVNPVTALLGLRTGELLDEATERILERIVEESVAVAKAAGIEVGAAAIMEAIRAVARATPDNKSSMLQDLERGKRTEIDAINGAIVERAQRLGVEAPLNDLLSRLVRTASLSRGGADGMMPERSTDGSTGGA